MYTISPPNPITLTKATNAYIEFKSWTWCAFQSLF